MTGRWRARRPSARSSARRRPVNEPGESVYVQAFPGVGAKWHVSTPEKQRCPETALGPCHFAASSPNLADIRASATSRSSDSARDRTGGCAVYLAAHPLPRGSEARSIALRHRNHKRTVESSHDGRRGLAVLERLRQPMQVLPHVPKERLVAGAQVMQAGLTVRRRGEPVLRTPDKPISPNNVLRRWVFPACLSQELPRATWLTFRRTYSTWAHQKGVPGKIAAQVMGHAKVDTALNVYTQVIDGSVVPRSRPSARNCSELSSRRKKRRS
jgi:hypothetical protein